MNEAVASGELHLTGLLMLGPHLTPENHLEVLARAKHRTKTELTKLLRTLNPFPELPARIEPLAPAPAPRPKTNPSWGDYIAAWAPVREIGQGDAPRDWMNDVLPEGAGDQPALARPAATESTWPEPAPARPEPGEAAPARSEVTPVTGALRYGVQFSADEEYVQLVERAKALLSRAHGKSSLEEVHLRAMRLLVAELEKRRFAKSAHPRREPETEGDASGESEEPHTSKGDAGKPRGENRRSRYIPAAVRREVFERDAARCTFVDSTGQRCRETHGLELHHFLAFARGGQHRTCNLTLRCAAHNALAAEEDFGRDFIVRKRGQTA